MSSLRSPGQGLGPRPLGLGVVRTRVEPAPEGSNIGINCSLILSSWRRDRGRMANATYWRRTASMSAKFVARLRTELGTPKALAICSWRSPVPPSGPNVVWRNSLPATAERFGRDSGRCARGARVTRALTIQGVLIRESGSFVRRLSGAEFKLPGYARTPSPTPRTRGREYPRWCVATPLVATGNEKPPGDGSLGIWC